MKIRDILKKDELKDLVSEINIFTEKMLRAYLDELGASFSCNEKELFDVVWGPVAFNPGEVALIDSPLIQRLRRIKQLGMASYVYSGADYSRFAHTVGVFKLAGDMAKIISQGLPNKDQAKYYEQIVRLAAIFHDSGHMYYSHVSEHYFMNNPKSSKYEEVKKIINCVSKIIDDTISLHELLSVTIVNSKATRELLDIIIPKLDVNNQDVEIITEYISCLIIGQANDKNILPYCQIINGSVDADRCDYLSRDSHATNVPVAVDIYRLVHKIRPHQGRMPETMLPQESDLWNKINEEESVYFPTIQESAVEALNHLLISRSIMYNSVYYHQKVRTIETMFRMVLEDMDAAGLPVVRNFSDIMLTTDDIFGDHFEDVFKAQGFKNIQAIQKKIKCICYRKLLKRACSIDVHDFQNQYHAERDLFKTADPKIIQYIEQKTAEEYKRICDLFEMDNESKTPDFKIVEFPKADVYHALPNIMVSYGDGSTKEYFEIFQTTTWIESKDSNKRESFLVTDCRHREYAFLALQKVLFDQYEVQIGIKSIQCAKVPQVKIKQLLSELIEKGYYDQNMILVADHILSPYMMRIKMIVDHYQTYEGENGYIVQEENILSFLKQFMRDNYSLEGIKNSLMGFF